MQQQSVVVMILLAFSGSLLVGSDFRMKSLPFYLSRRVDRRHYIVGKLLAISVDRFAVDHVPALLLFIEFGMFTPSTGYWTEHWDIVASVLAYRPGVLRGAQHPAGDDFGLSAADGADRDHLVDAFRDAGTPGLLPARETDNDDWRLLDPWLDIRLVGKLCFGVFRPRNRPRTGLVGPGILDDAVRRGAGRAGLPRAGCRSRGMIPAGSTSGRGTRRERTTNAGSGRRRRFRRRPRWRSPSTMARTTGIGPRQSLGFPASS